MGEGVRLLAAAGAARLGIIGWGWDDLLPDPRLLAAEAAPALRCDETWRLLVTDDHLVDKVGLSMIDAGCAGQVRLMALGSLPPRVQAPVPASWIG